MGSRVVTSLPRVGLAAIVTAALLVPIAFSRAFADPFTVPKATVLWVAAVIVLTALAVGLVASRGLAVPRPRAALPAGLLLGWTALATVLSETPATGWWGSHGRNDGLLTLLAGATLAVGLVVWTWRTPERLEVVVAAIVAGAVVGLGYLAAQQLGWAGADWQLQGTQGWLVGLGGNPNFSGAHLAMVVPLVLAARLRVTDGRGRIGLLGLAAALALGTWATGTRGGLVALVGGVAALGLLVPEAMPRAARAVAVVATVLLLAGVAASGAAEELPGRVPLGSAAVLQSGGLSQRQNIWATAVSVIEEHPLVGVGPDGFGRVSPRHRPSRGGLQLITADEAHNTFLDRAATAGLPALAAQLWLLGVVAVGAHRARRRLPVEHRWLLGAFGGLLAASVLQGLFSIDTVALAMLAWLGIGALVALADPGLLAAREGATADGGADPVSRPVPVALVVLGGVLALAGVAAVVRPALADRAHRVGQAALAADRPLDAFGHDADAAAWLGHEPRYQEAQAIDLVAAAAAPDTNPDLRRTLLDEAIVAYDHALDRSPDDVRLLVSRAQARVLAAAAADDPSAAAEQLDRAARTYRDLLRELRATDDLHLLYAQVREAEAELAPPGSQERAEVLADAATQFDIARSYGPDRLAATVALARVRLAQDRVRDARRLLVEAAELGGATDELDAAIEVLDRRISGAGG